MMSLTDEMTAIQAHSQSIWNIAEGLKVGDVPPVDDPPTDEPPDDGSGEDGVPDPIGGVVPDDAIMVRAGVKNLASAMAAAQPGDTYVMEAHPDPARAHVTILPANHPPIQGTADKPITIMAEPGATVAGMIYLGKNDRHVVIRDIEHIGNKGASTGYFVQMHGAQDIEIYNVRCSRFIHTSINRDTVVFWMGGDFLDIGADCIHSYNSDGVVIENCTAEWTGERFTIAGRPNLRIGENFIDIKGGDNWVIQNCTVIGPSRNSVDPYSWSDPGAAPLGSTSQGGEGVVIHKWGARNINIRDCHFSGMHTPVKVLRNSSLNEIAKSDPVVGSDQITVVGCTFDAGDQRHDHPIVNAAVMAGSGRVYQTVPAGEFPRVTVTGCEFIGNWPAGDVLCKGSSTDRHPVVTVNHGGIGRVPRTVTQGAGVINLG